MILGDLIGKRNLRRSYVFSWQHLGICIPVASIAIAHSNVRLRSSTGGVEEEEISSGFGWIEIIRYGGRIHIGRNRIVAVVRLDIAGRGDLTCMR